MDKENTNKDLCVDCYWHTDGYCGANLESRPQHDPFGNVIKCTSHIKTSDPVRKKREHASIHQIGDHYAKVCGCGSVHFHLLQSGMVECAKCQAHDLVWMTPEDKSELELTAEDALQRLHRGKPISESGEVSDE